MQSRACLNIFTHISILWLARLSPRVPRVVGRRFGVRMGRRTIGVMRSGISILFALFTAVAVASPSPDERKAQPETEQDEYTQYELLAPESASFKIVYEVTAITPGAKLFWNPIRKGSVASDEAVFDVFTGAPLKFEQVNGATAKEHGLGDADLASDYIEVHLARPVPLNGGEARLRIVKTYKDAKTYRREGDVIIFDRPLFIRRNAIILPAGYWLLECNVPSQILSERDGRTRISFMHQAWPRSIDFESQARPADG